MTAGISKLLLVLTFIPMRVGEFVNVFGVYMGEILLFDVFFDGRGGGFANFFIENRVLSDSLL